MAQLVLILRTTAMALLISTMSSAIYRRSVALPANVHILNAPTADDIISLQLTLRLFNIENLESVLNSVSDPDSPRYRSWMSVSKVKDLFPPVEGAAVRLFLTQCERY